MKPLSKKTYVEQALDNGKGITWLDDCRVPLEQGLNMKARQRTNNISAKGGIYVGSQARDECDIETYKPQGRFPANLLVSDDVLNDGRVLKSSGKRQGEIANSPARSWKNTSIEGIAHIDYDDSGSFSRYFDLDKWYNKTYPFFITPKASKKEKNKGCEGLEIKQAFGGGGGIGDYKDDINSASGKYGSEKAPASNNHPTVKPLKLMSYLITLGSREGDTVLDPFMGSGTTCLAAKMLGRKCIGIEIDKSYFGIAEARNRQMVL